MKRPGSSERIVKGPFSCLFFETVIMSAPTFATKWPTGFNPDKPDLLSLAAVISEHVEQNADPLALPPLHTHPSGQLALSTGGFVGIRLESGYWSIPANSAIWVPPGVPHTGVLGMKGRSVFFMVGPEHLEGFPTEVCRIMLNPMTIEMILFAARGNDRNRSPEAKERLALATIEEVRAAKRLPPHFAPLPASDLLRSIAMEFCSPEKSGWTMADWADYAGVSERTLARQVLADTGLTFRNWRLQHVLLVSISQLSRDVSVEEVSMTAGYQNTSAFISAFRQVFGCTPGEYRRMLQGA